MKPEVISALAAIISAICALVTVYFYRKQGKGFVWTKDHKILLFTNDKGNIHLEIEIPLFNLGKGNLRFIKLSAKKIYLKNNSIENYEMNMYEAYFPEGVNIINYKTKIFSDLIETDEKNPPQKIVLSNLEMPLNVDKQKLEKEINKKLSEIGECILIIHAFYKNGSWFKNQKDYYRFINK